MDCQRCKQLTKELEETKKELEKTKRELKRLKELLGRIAGFAHGKALAARNEMRGSIPRQRWEWIKAEFKMGNTILKIMGSDTVREKPKRKKGLIGLGQGFFDGIESLFGGGD